MATTNYTAKQILEHLQHQTKALGEANDIINDQWKIVRDRQLLLERHRAAALRALAIYDDDRVGCLETALHMAHELRSFRVYAEEETKPKEDQE